MAVGNRKRVKKGLKQVSRKIGMTLEERRQIAKERKRIFKEAFTKAEIGAIKERARQEARFKILGKPRKAKAQPFRGIPAVGKIMPTKSVLADFTFKPVGRKR